MHAKSAVVHGAVQGSPARSSGRQPMQVDAYFCPTDVEDVFSTVEWDHRTAAIKDENGGVLFEQTNCEIPKPWSALATNVVVSKYFYGEPGTHERETSVRQVIHRVARTLADWGIEDGYFASADDGENFYRELAWLCLHQHGAFNSPVWFNVGLATQYGIRGSQGNYYFDTHTKQVQRAANSYDYPQGSACFIQSVDDNMESIMRLATSEAMLFKFGSGTGSDLSTIRSSREKLSGGGTPSGPLSFMRVYDQIAAVVKSGGKTRRAAKMQSIKDWHPDVMEFIQCKAKEERKARTLIESGEYEANFNGEAYSSVMFQNANLSVRISDEFMRSVEKDGDWQTHWVTNAQVAGPSYKARDMLREIAQGTWFCGDPGVQYETTINKWHTCKNSGPINASNPCVTGDTLVSTAEGYRRIEEMVGQEAILVDQDGVRRPIRRIFPTGRKPVYRLTTRSGFQLRLTADHKVFTANRGDVPACELTRDDRLVLNPVGFGCEELDVETAEVVGLMLGDGSVHHAKSDGEPISTLTMSAGTESQIVTSVRERLNRLKSSALDGRTRREVTEGEGSVATVAKVATGSKSIAELFAKFAVLDQGSQHKRLTDAAMQLCRPAVAALLRGLYTADGCVYNYGDKSQAVSLDSTSLDMLRQVQLLLLGFGIKSKLYLNRRVGPLTAELPDGRGGSKEYAVLQMHSLRITRSSRVRFQKEIGFWPGSRKQQQLELVNATVATYQDRMDDAVAALEYVGEEDVFDLTEPVTHHFGANGLVVHNCSEYMFLDDTACNLASINLKKCLKTDGSFDVERFRRACRIYITAQEILVDHASYPTPPIAENSHLYRPLGLGYANLGSLLMTMGIPYDSDAGCGICGALTALLNGEAYRTSSEIAGYMGPFAGYKDNEQPMLDVMQMHRDAVEKIHPACPVYLKDAARQVWNECLQSGRRYGYRNAQATVLAPTGTIAFMMDCDTTGIEPDIALIKYKQLAGGGMMKIINRTVPASLKTLGYDEPQIKGILDYIESHETIEGAPALKSEHLPVFDCAFKAAKGTRTIPWKAHVTMMAAAQPFLSGAISKTVNMPADSTVEDIELAYIEGWKLGLKALAIYRDGSKQSQPLATSKEGDRKKGKAAEPVIAGPVRRRLPETRHSLTHKFSVGGHEGYITVGLFEDGAPGELFITMAKEGSTIGGLMDVIGTETSLALQYGVPLDALVAKFSHARFEPSGWTPNPDIPMAKSVVDYIFRFLGMTFLPGYREKNAPQRDSDPHAAKPGDSVAGSPGGTTNPNPASLKDGAGPAGKLTSGAQSPVSMPGQTYPSPAVAQAGTTATLQQSASVVEKLLEPYRNGQGSNGHGSNGHGANGVSARTLAKPGDHGRASPSQPGDSGRASGRQPGDSGRASERQPGDSIAGSDLVGSSSTILSTAHAHRLHSAHGTGLSTIDHRPSSRSEQFAHFQSDAPACDNCGAITVRNGNCYLCHNCGQSMGCS